MIKQSHKIDAFFTAEEHKDGFWDALREDPQMMPAHEWWIQDDDDAFEQGIAIAVEALSLNGSIYRHDTETGENSFYWVGDEDEIVNRLQSGWIAWQESNKPKARNSLLNTRKQKLAELQKFQEEINLIDDQLNKQFGMM